MLCSAGGFHGMLAAAAVGAASAYSAGCFHAQVQTSSMDKTLAWLSQLTSGRLSCGA
jgi:hypothetical protein